VVVQEDAHPPHSWRPLSQSEQAQFDLGYAVFNTEWVPANSPAGRIDGLGRVFNVQGCDACHNSRRRGRGPRGHGEAPGDVVLQLGGTDLYGRVLNTAAIPGFKPEGQVWIQYTSRMVRLCDGNTVELHEPHYRIAHLAGPPLPGSTVLAPRMPPAVQGAGLLELVPQAELESVVSLQERETPDVRGRISWIQTDHDRLIGRLGWQAKEATVADQVAVAFSREMGLTNPVVAVDDCGQWDAACRAAPAGGTPEVASNLFEAVVAFERWHAVPVAKMSDQSEPGARIFARVGCADCHRSTLAIDPGTVIHPYADLLLHNLGDALADRSLSGAVVPSAWRTAPLWGLHASIVTKEPVRLLHDGRARSIEEAILWHGGEAHRAREAYSQLDAQQRRSLTEWIAGL
jgi:CxxC motif-containing protein (DUF1111 family)